jgi:maleylacetate reductase
MDQSSFIYNGQPSRVVFGSGTIASLSEEVAKLGLKRVLVLSTPPKADDAQKISDRLGDVSVGVFPRATMHTPVSVTDEAMVVVGEKGVDGVIAIGGGSTTGLGKAIALRTDLPQIVIPTTYAGSEMTPILGETKDGNKVTQSSPRILPEVVIYDVDLTMSLPVTLSGTSGINAIAHAVEALYARDRNPIVSMMALEAIGALHDALPAIASNPHNRDARSKALYGAWLCGVCLGSVGMALHHKLCHTVGGSFDLPHAETHTIILPHALAYNAPAIPEVMKRLQDVLHTDNPAMALYELAGKVGAKRALADIGMTEEGIEIATDKALANPYWNPRPLDRASLHGLISRAYAGDRPFTENS